MNFDKTFRFRVKYCVWNACQSSNFRLRITMLIKSFCFTKLDWVNLFEWRFWSLTCQKLSWKSFSSRWLQIRLFGVFYFRFDLGQRWIAVLNNNFLRFGVIWWFESSNHSFKAFNKNSFVQYVFSFFFNLFYRFFSLIKFGFLHPNDRSYFLDAFLGPFNFSYNFWTLSLK